MNEHEVIQIITEDLNNIKTLWFKDNNTPLELHSLVNDVCRHIREYSPHYNETIHELTTLGERASKYYKNDKERQKRFSEGKDEIEKSVVDFLSFLKHKSLN